MAGVFPTNQLSSNFRLVSFMAGPQGPGPLLPSTPSCRKPQSCDTSVAPAPKLNLVKLQTQPETPGRDGYWSQPLTREEVGFSNDKRLEAAAHLSFHCLLLVQISHAFTSFGQSFRIRQAVLIGGMNGVGQQKTMLKRPHVVTSTPGRLLDFLEGSSRVSVAPLEQNLGLRWRIQPSAPTLAEKLACVG